jgi:hypothetical protein
MSSVPIAVVMTIFAAVLLVFFWWFAEVRARWKLGAFAAFALALVLLTRGDSPWSFVTGLALQTFVAISLILYFKTEP